MAYDRRRSFSRPLLVLQAVVLAVSLASIDKVFEFVDRYFSQVANTTRTNFPTRFTRTLIPHDNVATWRQRTSE